MKKEITCIILLVCSVFTLNTAIGQIQAKKLLFNVGVGSISTSFNDIETALKNPNLFGSSFNMNDNGFTAGFDAYFLVYKKFMLGLNYSLANYSKANNTIGAVEASNLKGGINIGYALVNSKGFFGYPYMSINAGKHAFMLTNMSKNDIEFNHNQKIEAGEKKEITASSTIAEIGIDIKKVINNTEGPVLMIGLDGGFNVSSTSNWKFDGGAEPSKGVTQKSISSVFIKLSFGVVI